MAVLNQDYEEGTNGTTITIANSAGSGENAVDTAVIATSNTMKYDTTVQLTSGSVSLKHACSSAASGNCYWAWYTSFGTQSNYYLRSYFKIDTAVTSLLFIGMSGTGAGTIQDWGVKISSSGKIQLMSGSTTISTSTTSIAINTVFRMEVHVDYSTTSVTVRIFVGGNSEGSTPDETISYTGQTMGSATADIAIRIGASNVATYNLWSDAVRFDTANWIGAANPPAATTLTGMTIAATSTVSGKVVERHKISGAISATATVGGTITKPGTVVVNSTYGVGVYGVAVYGGSGAPPPTGITGLIRATATVGGAISRLGGGGGIYTPPYTPPTPPPPPLPILGTFDTFAQAVYDLLDVDTLLS